MTAGRVVRPVGDSALLAECGSTAEAVGLWRLLTDGAVPGVREAVPAARTVLVLVDRGAARPVRARLEALAVPERPLSGAGTVVLDTVYDGEDLDEVAALLRTTPDAVVATHVATTWTAAFVGFAPGFTYLTAPDGALQVPRRDVPRVRVPAGSVALGGPYSAVYPRDTPGGWRLLGRTDAVLWDPERPDPAVLRPGTTVRFRAVRPHVVGTGGRVGPPRADRAATAHRPGSGAAPGPWGALEVVTPGPSALVEDLGRPGMLHLGVPRSGAVDRWSAVAANRLVGNDRAAAVVETVGGLVLRAHGHQVVAVTGAEVALEIVVPGAPEPDGAGTPGAAPGEQVVARPRPGRPVPLADGAVLRVGLPARGARAYVAVRGGLAVPAELGSRSTDLLSGLGPSPLGAGDLLPVGPDPGEAVADVPPGLEHAALPVAADGAVAVRAHRGPRHDRVTPQSLDALGAARWTVSADSSRIGLRLDGPPLERVPGPELDSEGALPGAVQVPPSGRPIVLLADHPVTGGYPVVAVVDGDDLDLLGRLAPGDEVRLRLLDDDR